VEDGVAAVDGAAQAIGVEQVDPAVADVGALLAQLANDVPADEPACSGDVDLQRAPSLVSATGSSTSSCVRRVWP
jgi:hypothetical protein